MNKNCEQVFSKINKYIAAYQYAKGSKPPAITVTKKDFAVLQNNHHAEWKNVNGKASCPPPSGFFRH